MSYAKDVIISRLAQADIQVNGKRPWDVQIHNDDLYKTALHKGTVGVGEAYMQGWWDCEKLDEMFCRVLEAGADRAFSDSSLPGILLKVYQSARNLQNSKRVYDVANAHYNFGNDMFEAMLGPSMNYSCAYWKDADDLDSAQQAKMELICKKLKLEPGMSVVDIGSGWGALGQYMAKNYGARVTGVSVSSEQVEYARQKCPEAEWLLEDYRSLQGKFDRVVSIGMFEHVGYKNYKEFMRKARELLHENGLMLLHTIGANQQRKGTDPWIDKYIFPNGMVPSQANLAAAAAPYFIMEDWHNFGAHYDRTLMAWHSRFEAGCDQNRFPFTETTRRMFRYYLLSCAAAFRSRSIQLWQLVLSPRGVRGGYESIR